MNPAMTAAAPLAESPGRDRCPYLVVRDPDAVREVLHRPAVFRPLEYGSPQDKMSLQGSEAI